MLKIYDFAIVEPLSLIYEKCLESCKYLSLWKKANVLSIHKRESRQLKKNYRPISMLPICLRSLLLDKGPFGPVSSKAIQALEVRVLLLAGSFDLELDYGFQRWAVVSVCRMFFSVFPLTKRKNKLNCS